MTLTDYCSEVINIDGSTAPIGTESAQILKRLPCPPYESPFAFIARRVSGDAPASSDHFSVIVQSVCIAMEATERSTRKHTRRGNQKSSGAPLHQMQRACYLRALVYM